MVRFKPKKKREKIHSILHIVWSIFLRATRARVFIPLSCKTSFTPIKSFLALREIGVWELIGNILTISRRVKWTREIARKS